MKVDIITRTLQQIQNCDYMDKMVVFIDGESAFEIADDEPLSSEVDGVEDLPELLEYFYNLGKSGLDVEFNKTQSDEI